MSGDITVAGHDRGPLYGTESIGFYVVCGCGDRFDGLSRNEAVDAHEQHVGALALKPGVAKARRMLADTLERGKPEPAEVQA
jgi:hypothetical protein